MLGDSHALALRELLDQLAREHQLSGYFIAAPGSIPIPNLATKQLPPNPDLLDRGDATARLITEHKIKNVILIARWSAYVEGLSDYDLASDSTRQRASLLAVDSESREVSPNEAPHALRRALTNFLQHHLPSETTLWILQQVPESKTGIAEIGTKLKLLGLPFNPPLTTKADHDRRQRRANDILHNLQATGARLLDPTSHFFNSQDQLVVEADGRFLYRDEDHLTPHGAALRLTPLLDPVLRHIADPRSPAPTRTAIQPVNHHTPN
ncbi:MAG: SGNH hydrolase domain-containing protein [Planctomycetales bacterium]